MPRAARAASPSAGKVSVYSATRGYLEPDFLREWSRVRRPERYLVFVMRVVQTVLGVSFHLSFGDRMNSPFLESVTRGCDILVRCNTINILMRQV